jgi:hypothetical protein
LYALICKFHNLVVYFNELRPGYSTRTLANQNYIHEQNKSRLYSWKACYQKICKFTFLSSPQAICKDFFFHHGATAPSGSGPPHYPLGEWSARRRDLYLPTHTTVATNEHPYPRRDSNLQSQQARSSRSRP